MKTVVINWPGEHRARILGCGILLGPAAAAKSLQLCPTLCDPIDGSPPGSPVPEILQILVIHSCCLFRAPSLAGNTDV